MRFYYRCSVEFNKRHYVVTLISALNPTLIFLHGIKSH